MFNAFAFEDAAIKCRLCVNSCVIYSLILSDKNDRNQFSWCIVFLSSARKFKRWIIFFRFHSISKTKNLSSFYDLWKSQTVEIQVYFYLVPSWIATIKVLNKKLERMCLYRAVCHFKGGDEIVRIISSSFLIRPHFMHPHPSPTRKSEKKIDCVFYLNCLFLSPCYIEYIMEKFNSAESHVTFVHYVNEKAVEHRAFGIYLFRIHSDVYFGFPCDTMLLLCIQFSAECCSASIAMRDDRNNNKL